MNIKKDVIINTIAVAFIMYDLNKNGYITREEFKVRLRKYMIMLFKVSIIGHSEQYGWGQYHY